MQVQKLSTIPSLVIKFQVKVAHRLLDLKFNFQVEIFVVI